MGKMSLLVPISADVHTDVLHRQLSVWSLLPSLLLLSDQTSTAFLTKHGNNKI